MRVVRVLTLVTLLLAGAAHAQPAMPEATRKPPESAAAMKSSFAPVVRRAARAADSAAGLPA